MPNVPSRPLPPPLLLGEAGELKLPSIVKDLRLYAECTFPPPYPLPSFQERRGSWSYLRL